MLVKWMLASASGIATVSFIPTLPTPVWCGPFVLLFLMSLKYRRLLVIGAFSLGVLWAYGYGWSGLTNRLDPALEGRELTIEGIIDGLPDVSERSQRFNFIVKTLTPSSDGGNHVPPLAGDILIRLNWYQVDERVTPGQAWRFIVKLKRPRGLVNPAGFNYETWLFRSGIGATGYVRDTGENQLLEERWWHSVLSQLRFLLLQRMHRTGNELPQLPLLEALLLGEGGRIDADSWSLFSRTGTNHLFVISGLHIGFIALCGYGCGFYGIRLVRRDDSQIASQRVAMLVAILFATVYAFLAGFSLPTQRALIMLICGFGLRYFYLKVSVWQGFSAALLAVLVLDPLAMHTGGFWLSFVAVGGLLFAFQGYTHQAGIWWKWGRPQWVVFLILSPLLISLFSQASLIAPIANILSIPVVGLVIVPLTLCAGVLLPLSTNLARGLLEWADILLGLLLDYLWVLDQLPFSMISVPGSVLVAIIALFGALLMVLPRGLPARWAGASCLLVLLTYPAPRPQTGGYSVWFYDVGQGTAVLIQTAKHALLYDTGPRFSERFNAADAVVVPHLQQRDIQRLDKLIVSHGDLDHAGALPNLLEQISVTELVAGTPLDTDHAVSPCRSGRTWQWDDIGFTLFQANLPESATQNSRSCVLLIEYQGARMLLSGDIERDAETDLVRRYGKQLSAEILLVPHHGSQTSSSELFLKTVAPNIAIYTSGYRNRFGHPHPAVNQRYVDRGVTLYNTANSGAIQVKVSPGASVTEIYQARIQRRRYWFGDQYEDRFQRPFAQ